MAWSRPARSEVRAVRPRIADPQPARRWPHGPASGSGPIDHTLLPPRDSLGGTEPEAFAQLKRDLAVVVSAEALYTLTDLCGLGPDDAVASAVRTARTLTGAALR
ncbi:hypothetical protein SAMN05216268_13141 [Streptomyces yunnanensis]|uniref:Uncharacterized protein n=1 Tax=Streptomyces yunnanensis TaxID=156453 RepID=A0A9X8N8U2_9ACTN|nr:hypothetical protein SAMN05216268_13141 [Streptomyces yunnanensis]